MAVQGKRGFTDRHVLKEGMHGGQTVVSCPRTVAALEFEMIEKLRYERGVEIFRVQCRRRSEANWSNRRKASR